MHNAIMLMFNVSKVATIWDCRGTISVSENQGFTQLLLLVTMIIKGLKLIFYLFFCFEQTLQNSMSYICLINTNMVKFNTINKQMHNNRQCSVHHGITILH